MSGIDGDGPGGGWALLNGEDPWDVVIRLRKTLRETSDENERLRKQNESWERTARAYEKDFKRLRAEKEYLEELLHAERTLKGGE